MYIYIHIYIYSVSANLKTFSKLFGKFLKTLNFPSALVHFGTDSESKHYIFISRKIQLPYRKRKHSFLLSNNLSNTF